MPDNIYRTGEPQPLGSVEWISYRFNELNEDDLFWFEKNLDSEKNPPFRKAGPNLALDLRNQRTIEINPRLRVHQKEW